jgi:hypothetical protein
VNWPAIVVTAGLLMVAFSTLPWGLLVLGALYWVWRRS